MELTETTTIADLPENTTLVKVQLTDVKYFDEIKNTVEVSRLIGRVTVAQAREYVKSLHESFIYITKETVADTFPVNTINLYSLKQDK